jgi:putative addiction module component (TIGR02574 family)
MPDGIVKATHLTHQPMPLRESTRPSWEAPSTLIDQNDGVLFRQLDVACYALKLPTGGTMPIPLHELEAEVLGLPPEERAQLLERLIESFEPESRIRDAWIALSLRREDEVRSGKVQLVPGVDALARVRARIA